MNRVLKNKKITPVWAVLLLCVVPVLAWGQHKTPSAPAPKAAPAQHSVPSHTTAPSRPAAQSHTTTPSHSTTGTRPATGGSRPTTTGGNRPATAGGSRPGASTGTRPTTGGTRPTGGANRPTAGGNRPAAGGNRPAAGGNRPSPGASRGNVSRTPPGRTVSLRGGGSANIRPNGSIRSVDRNGMHIERGVGGRRTVVSERNGARIVTSGHGGYVQRAYVTRGGVSYVSRTYVYGGVTHVGVYRSYYWGGHAYYGWHAGFYWHPGFYGWAYNPWPGPVYWGVGLWGWGGSPWWGFYGGWWNPYPYYAAPAFWLTDYLIASELQAAYAARQEARADEMAADAQASAPPPAGGDAQAAPASGQVTLTPEVKEAIDLVLARFQSIDVLVANAGIEGPMRDFGTVTTAEWDRLMAVNVRGPFLTVRACLPGMRARHSGVIVLTASNYGLVATPHTTAYCTSKGAVAALGRALAVELVPDGIRVNCVCPGNVDTPMFDRALAMQTDEPARVKSEVGRMATPDEIANVIVFLASEEASYMTGAHVVVDYGETSRTGPVWQSRNW